ncbi:MAG TPA: hypothetical protein VIQ02_00715 [Jiangellaceae bacterium]
MSQYVKREPWPFHIKIDGRGYLIGSQGANQPALVSAKAQDISAVSPPSYEYAGLNPLHEREQPYESLVLGLGMKVQEEWQDFRYAYAMGVDLSVWPSCRGPEIVATSGTAGQVVDFFELGGNLYVAAGSSVYRLTTGTNTWTATATFGQPILAASVFASNFDGIPRVWVALQGAPAQYSSDGAAFTAMATFQALGFAAVGREWWWADDVNRLRKVDVDADPTDEANYTSLQFRVGDRSAPITALMVTAAGTLIVAKTDGLYTLDAAGDQQPLFPFLQYAPVATNGKAWGQFLDDLYVAYGTNFSRLNPDLSLESVGPERLVNNDSPVRGSITAFAGVGTMFAYAAIYNPDTATSFLLKFGGYRVKEGETERLDAWHGSLNAGWSGSYPTKLFVSSIGAPAGHTRTYVGRNTGQVEWLTNPCVPNPAACSQYRFAVGSGYVEMPLWHGGYHASNKSVRHLAISSTFVNGLNYATVEYSLTPTGALVDAGDVFDTPVYQQVTLPTTTTAVLAKFRVHLHNANNTASPLISAFSVGHALRPMRVMTFEADILCADGLVRRDGVQMRMGRTMIRQFIEQAVDTPGAVRVVLPDETIQDLSFTNYRISQAFDEVGRQWRGALRITATQWTTAEVPS